MPRRGVSDSVVSGFIANTDFGWFSHFLHRVEPLDEVDFRQPSPHGFKAIPPGAPFFFRLGKPHFAIAGFGFFARRTGTRASRAARPSTSRAATDAASSPSALSARRSCGRRRSRSQTSSAATARHRSCGRAPARAPSASPSPAPAQSRASARRRPLARESVQGALRHAQPGLRHDPQSGRRLGPAVARGGGAEPLSAVMSRVLQRMSVTSSVASPSWPIPRRGRSGRSRVRSTPA